MEIKTKAKARVRQYKVMRNEAKDGTIREVDLEIGYTRAQCALAFGDRITEAVFAGFISDEGDTDGEWKLKNPKPSNRVVCGNHRIDIEGDGFVGQPRIRSFATVKDTEKVVAVIRIELGEAQGALRRKLEGQPHVDITIQPSNLQLPLGERTVNIADAQMTIVKGGANAGAAT